MTAAEWLVLVLKDSYNYQIPEEVAKQVKKLENNQIMEAYNNGYMDCYDDDFITEIPISIGDISQYDNAINYYNENFEKDESI
jgi:hypothetical protein